jgi:hypothetical protein
VNQDKNIYYTLDLEPDYAGVAPSETYEAYSNKKLLNKFAEIIDTFDIKLTVFVTGKLLNSQREQISFFQQLGAEFELHGYDHVMYQPEFMPEVEKGLDAYLTFFGRYPLGYRSPGGVMDPHLFEILANEGIKYDSSLIPSFRLGTYRNLNSPLQPHFPFDSSVLEIPMGVVPRIRALISASYIRLFGFSTYKLLFRLFGLPDRFVYLFHLVDLIPVTMRHHLTPFYQSAYAIRENNGMAYFEATARYFQNRGYRSAYLSSLFYEFTDKLSATS